jgi:hypothetical protein
MNSRFEADFSLSCFGTKIPDDVPLGVVLGCRSWAKSAMSSVESPSQVMSQNVVLSETVT